MEICTYGIFFCVFEFLNRLVLGYFSKQTMRVGNILLLKPTKWRPWINFYSEEKYDNRSNFKYFKIILNLPLAARNFSAELCSKFCKIIIINERCRSNVADSYYFISPACTARSWSTAAASHGVHLKILCCFSSTTAMYRSVIMG